MKFNLEASLGYSNKEYKTEAGNGTCIPQYKQDEKLGRMVPLKRKDGKRKVTNLYLQIQKAKSSTDYKKLIEKDDMDLEKIKMIFKDIDPQNAFNNAIDYSNFGTIETYKALENKINGKFGNIANFNAFVDKKLSNFNQQLKNIENTQKEEANKAKKKYQAEYNEFLEWKKSNKK